MASPNETIDKEIINQTTEAFRCVDNDSLTGVFHSLWFIQRSVDLDIIPNKAYELLLGGKIPFYSEGNRIHGKEYYFDRESFSRGGQAYRLKNTCVRKVKPKFNLFDYVQPKYLTLPGRGS